MDSLVSENEVKAFEILDRLLDENREKLEKLHSLLGYLSTFPLSQAVAENQQPVSEVYEAYPRLDYLLQNTNFDSQNTDKKSPKTDFYEKNNPNIGWKLHLNVSPEDVKDTFDFLVSEKYRFKYLAGPYGGKQPPTQKVFTVYTGSLGITSEIATQLSSDLSVALRRPDSPGDIELAEGIAGRFYSEGGPLLTYYGTLGIQHSHYDINALKELGFTKPYSPEHQKGIEMQSLRMITNPNFGYGKYFFDLDLLQ